MLLSQLNEMSIGPLWKLRTVDTPEQSQGAFTANVPTKSIGTPRLTSSNTFCEVCGKPQLDQVTAEASVLVVLAEPISDEVQRQLLENCLFAIGKQEQYSSFSVHQACETNPHRPEQAQRALQACLSSHSYEVVVVFGQTAKLIDAAFLADYESKTTSPPKARFIITHHPAEMIADPSIKAKVWSDICRAYHGI